jgi:hypothetical protein
MMGNGFAFGLGPDHHIWMGRALNLAVSRHTHSCMHWRHWAFIFPSRQIPSLLFSHISYMCMVVRLICLDIYINLDGSVCLLIS